MALRYLDSFDLYDTAGIAARWNYATTVTSTAVTMVPSAGRNGSQCMRFDSSGCFVSKFIDSQGTWCVGMAVKITGAPVSINPLIVFPKDGTANCGLAVDSSLRLNVCRGSTTTVTGGTSTNTLSLGTWYYIEVVVTPVASVAANSCYVNVDGVNWATVAAGQNLRGAGVDGADGIQIRGVASAAAHPTDIDDLYICDGQAGLTGPLGNMMVQVLCPDTDSFPTYNNWTPSAGSYYTCLNEMVANGDTNYIYCETTGPPLFVPGSRNVVQLVETSDMTYTPAAFYGVQWNMYARRSDAGYRFLTSFVRSHINGVTSIGTVDHSVGIDYQFFHEIFEGDPCNSNVAWDRWGINEFEPGVMLDEFG